MEEKIEENFNEIEATYAKISEAMDLSRDKKDNIENMTSELYEETRPMMVEKRKEEIEKAKNDKAEFDEMTKGSLLNLKKDILKLKKEAEESLNQKMLDTLKQKKLLEKRAEAVKRNMQEKGFEAEKIESINEKKQAAENEIDKSMTDFQSKNSKITNKLDEYEKNIIQFAVELDFLDEFEKVQIEDLSSEVQEETQQNETSQEEASQSETSKEEKSELTAKDIMEDLLRIQQTDNPKDLDKLRDSLSDKYADASSTWKNRIKDVLLKQQQKMEKSKEPKAIKDEIQKDENLNAELDDEISDISRDEKDVLEGLDLEGLNEEVSRIGEDETKGRNTKKDDEPFKIENLDSVVEKKVNAPKYQKLQPQIEDVEIGEDGTTHTHDEYKIDRIEIDEASGYVSAINDEGTQIYNKQIEYDFEKDMMYSYKDILVSDEAIEKVEAIKNNLIDEYGEDLFCERMAFVDQRVLTVLSEMGKTQMIEDYIYSIFEKDETMPFEMNYNLKDIYDTDKSLGKIDHLRTISKIAKKQNRDMVEIEKDALPKRLFGRIKKGIQERFGKIKEAINNRRVESLPPYEYEEDDLRDIEKEKSYEVKDIKGVSEVVKSVGKNDTEYRFEADSGDSFKYTIYDNLNSKIFTQHGKDGYYLDVSEKEDIETGETLIESVNMGVDYPNGYRVMTDVSKNNKSIIIRNPEKRGTGRSMEFIYDQPGEEPTLIKVSTVNEVGQKKEMSWTFDKSTGSYSVDGKEETKTFEEIENEFAQNNDGYKITGSPAEQMFNGEIKAIPDEMYEIIEQVDNLENEEKTEKSDKSTEYDDFKFDVSKNESFMERINARKILREKKGKPEVNEVEDVIVAPENDKKYEDNNVPEEGKDFILNREPGDD